MNTRRQKTTVMLVITLIALTQLANACAEEVGQPLVPVAEHLATEIAATETAMARTPVSATTPTQVVKPADTSTAAPAQTVKSADTPTIAPSQTAKPIDTPTSAPTSPPTPQTITKTVQVGEVATFGSFNVSVTTTQYEPPQPKGAFFVTLSLENKTTSPLPYSVKNFTVTSSGGAHKLLALPSVQGSTWSEDFLPNSVVPPSEKAILKLLAEHLGTEKNFVLTVIFGNSVALVPLGR